MFTAGKRRQTQDVLHHKHPRKYLKDKSSMEYTLETDEDTVNVHYILDSQGDSIFRYVGDVQDLEAVLSHLNMG
jgi:hypothetical protein